MEMSSGSDSTFSFASGWKAISLPMHGQTDSGCPGCNRSGGAGGVIFEGAAIGRAMPGLESYGCTGATAVLAFHKINIDFFNLW